MTSTSRREELQGPPDCVSGQADWGPRGCRSKAQNSERSDFVREIWLMVWSLLGLKRRNWSFYLQKKIAWLESSLGAFVSKTKTPFLNPQFQAEKRKKKANSWNREKCPKTARLRGAEGSRCQAQKRKKLAFCDSILRLFQKWPHWDPMRSPRKTGGWEVSSDVGLEVLGPVCVFCFRFRGSMCGEFGLRFGDATFLQPQAEGSKITIFIKKISYHLSKNDP